MAKKSTKREIIEWAVLITVVGTLYLTGYHTDVIGFVQRAVLSTGVFTPKTEYETIKNASYDFSITDFDGNEIPFEAFRGKTVFVNFWATWCPPCIAEMPDINNLYDKVNADVSFVMISVDEDHEKAKKFMARKGYDFPVYFLTSSLPPIYETHSIPTTYIIAPDGTIAAERHGMAQYDSEEFRVFLKALGKG